MGAGTVSGQANVGTNALLAGPNNFAVDPVLVFTNRGLHRLDPSSPARDLCAAGTGRDLDGLLRVDDPAVLGLGFADSGAFERP